MCAPVAHPRRVRTEIACGAGRLDGAPDRHQRLLEAQQLVEIGGVVQHLAVGQIEQPQPRGQHAPGPQQRHGIELHLEHGLEFGQCPRLGRCLAGLVVDHPQLAGGRDVDAVDEAAQQCAVLELDLDALFAALRVEPRRVLQPVVARTAARGPHRGVRPAARARSRRPGRAARRRRAPTRARRASSRCRGPLGGGQRVELFQRRMHHRTAHLRGRGRLRQPVDGAEPVEQRALLEVAGPRRRQRRPPYGGAGSSLIRQRMATH